MDLAERLLYFRALPASGAATAQELLPLAEAAREVFLPKGTVVFEQGQSPERFVCLVEGAVALTRGELVLGTLEAPAVVGIRAVLARVPMPYKVRTLGPTSALEVVSDRFLQTIEDDFDLWKRQLRFQNGEMVKRLALFPEAMLGVRRVDLSGLPTHRELDLVERMLLVRRLGFFGRGSVNALAELSQHLVASTVPAGEPIFRRGEPAFGPIFVVRGEASAQLSPDHRVVFVPGSVLGGPEAMAESTYGYDVIAERECALLKLDLESFFDVVEDNTEIASGFLSGAARVVFELDVAQMVARAEAAAAGSDAPDRR